MASKPGERKLQILQTVAQMLEQPKGEKITTAALAAKNGLRPTSSHDTNGMAISPNWLMQPSITTP